jgi:hypothetical protein
MAIHMYREVGRAPRGHLVVSGEVLGCHMVGVAAASKALEVSDCSTMLRTAHPTEFLANCAADTRQQDWVSFALSSAHGA